MRILFLLFTITLSSTQSVADTGSTGPGQILDAARLFLDGFRDEQANQSFRVEYSLGSLDPRLNLAPCPDGMDVAFSGDPWRSTQPSLLVSCGGDRPWRMYLSASMEIHGDALVAARPLARGDRVQANMIRRQPVVVNAVRRGAITDQRQLLGMELKRPVNTGTPFTPDLVVVPDAVSRGDHVMIIATNGAFSVTSRGKALANARVGEQVMVENLASSRRIRGRVVGPGQVEIAM
ncbi:flagella basal body P-ring formation protein FlgA [Marinobacter daqiaonensis]|uniref:Flagella basal body P-ring formation protein FlgA n=1 Tax=Marinobacter daqiaonensis TaxID=650891 RepID=A0A1I6GMV1_9GAMM|nr:flagellar basal body P-ring formation chaperone FlgA [Marinobacter daqiaonensis]SFR43498.1 flagella basal body P-ring formation protein FlgA [Marinobacter daqiaonensis]